MVEVILRKDVADLGLAGEMVNVRPGYARNYLIPQGIALVATEGNRRRFEEERRQIEQSAEREREAAQQLAGELEGREVSFVRRASEGGRLFGSVTAADIADELEKEGRRRGPPHDPAGRSDQGPRRTRSHGESPRGRRARAQGVRGGRGIAVRHR